jgi:hypothetical protein
MLFSCSTVPPAKDQDQLEKERISLNYVRIQRMYSLDYADGKPVDSTGRLITDFYFDPDGNQTCTYDCESSKHELIKICRYDANGNKTTEILLGVPDFLRWKYYKMLYTHDSLNRLETMRMFNTVGRWYFGHFYYYDFQERLICDIMVDADFEAIGADSLLYRADNRDPYQKRFYLLGDSGELVLDQSVHYFYDSNRNLIEEKSFNNVNELVSRTTSCYNAEGLKEKSISWDCETNKPQTGYRYEYIRYRMPD